MSTLADVPQIQKRLVRNNTSGWIGVVRLNHNGEEEGINIEPGGTMWLSDAEMVLTARAPRRPEDNPFELRTYVAQDPVTLRRSEVQMRPIELVDADPRLLSATDRYVPGVMNDQEAAALGAQAAHDGSDFVSRGPAVVAKEAEVMATAGPGMRPEQPMVPPVATPGSTGSGEGSPDGGPIPQAQAPVPAPQVTRGLQGGASAAQTPETTESWTDPPADPGVVLRGSLAGDDIGELPGGHALTQDPTLPQPGDSINPGLAGPLSTPPATPMARVDRPGPRPSEEHAARVDPNVPEETGAARPPAQAAPEGEYASREEIGSPDAPDVDDDTSGLIGG